MKPVRLLVVPLALVALLGCANRNSSSTASGQQAEAAAPAEPAAKPIPKGHVLEKIKTDMTDAQVKQILGAPTSMHAYPSAKTFIPYYYGTEGSREGWIYKGKGQVTFSRNRWNGQLTVIEVLYDPSLQ